MMPRAINPNIAAAIIRDYLAGTPGPEVAARYGVGTETVYRYVKRAGHEVKRRAPASDGLPDGEWVTRNGVQVWRPGGEVA